MHGCVRFFSFNKPEFSIFSFFRPKPSQPWSSSSPGFELSFQASNRLEKAAKTMQAHFDRSNFAVEIHQCYLDLVVCGTAALSFEEAEPGGFSAFKFSAAPLKNIVLEEGVSGQLDGAFRTVPMTLDQLRERYPSAQLPSDLIKGFFPSL